MKNTPTPSPIAVAVKPLEALAVAQAEAAAQAQLTALWEKLEAAEWDVNAVAPYPSYNDPKYSTKEKNAPARRWHDFVNSVVSSDGSKPYNSRFGTPTYVLPNPERSAAFVESCGRMAADHYRAYVGKLESKVGEHIAAELEYNDGLWHDSTLRVTKANGEVERWNTKVILNYSVYGLAYNQWPTRKVTGGRA